MGTSGLLKGSDPTLLLSESDSNLAENIKNVNAMTAWK